jgi:large subunit ribosomal protein L17
MILHGNIRTTKAKAQAVRSELERLITKAKKGTEAMRRDILSSLDDRKITSHLIEMSKTQFGNRNSGYTRIVKLGMRNGDASEMVSLSFVDEKVVAEVVKPKEEKKEIKKRTPKKKTV